jgi:molecular chaperone HscA
LSDEDITRMLGESIAAADEDRQARMLREQQVEAQRVLEAARSALLSDGDLLDAGERQRIVEAIEDLARAAEGDRPDNIVSANLALGAATENLAMQRMNRSIRAALAGARIDEVLAPAVRQSN